MTQLTGMVAILADGQVVEVKDLGPAPVTVKTGQALPLEENKPALGPNQRYSPFFTFTILADKVIRNWAVLDPTAEELHDISYQEDPDRLGLVDRLRTATPAQIDAYIDSNVTNLAGARTLLKHMLRVLALLAKT
jgi:hypothetical protein